MATQVDKAVKMAYGTLVFISSGMSFKSCIECWIGYYMRFWWPYRKDVINLERVQETNGNFAGTRGSEYKERG